MRISYCIADYNTTKLETNGVGIREITHNQTDLTKEFFPDAIKEKWSKYIGQEITETVYYIQSEEWENYTHN
jgi:hypothetical protein